MTKHIIDEESSKFDKEILKAHSFDLLEDRQSDWLAKERERELRHSPWNFDEAKEIKEEHAKLHARADWVLQRTNQKEKEVYRSSNKSPAEIDIKIIQRIVESMAFVISALVIASILASLVINIK